MKVCKLIPHGFPCSVEECPPGFFLWRYGGDHDCVAFKSEYHHSGDRAAEPQVYNEAGEYIHSERLEHVQPLEVSWEEE